MSAAGHFLLIKKMIKISNLFLTLFFFFPILAEEQFAFSHNELKKAIEHTLNFNEISVIEFIRYVSRISDVNFIYNQNELNFNVTLSSGKSSTPDAIVDALVQLLKIHGFKTKKHDQYYFIYKSDDPNVGEGLARKTSKELQFFTYKLQYTQGGEIQETLKKISSEIKGETKEQQYLLNAIHSLQWVKSTNSFFFSCDQETAQRMNQIIDSLDVPLRQVFIEVLVIETDVKNILDFGLEWATGGVFQNKVGFGTGNFPVSKSPFSEIMKGIGPSSPPTGLSQVPLGRGFDLGVIGDIITHKGKSFLTLGTLVSALQADGDSTIILNQKIITQDNKNSKIFSGDNIPFTGSVVQTISGGQQTSANVEYRDVGVSLSITPVLGEGNMITLNIEEEITEAVNDDVNHTPTATVSGIRTSKTNMVTQAHVPDNHFLVLSGMARNAKRKEKTGIPCLGGLPLIGALFSRTVDRDEKKNIIIFVRPRIIHSEEEYQELSGEEKSKTPAYPSEEE